MDDKTILAALEDNTWDREPMGIIEAMRIVEGRQDSHEHQWIEAWQVLIDRGAASSFKGIIETTAAALVSLGYCRHNVHTWKD